MELALNVYISPSSPARGSFNNSHSGALQRRSAIPNSTDTGPAGRSFQVRISPEGKKLSSTGGQFSPQTATASSEQESANRRNGSGSPAETHLTSEEIEELQELQKRDSEVRAHEQAHLAAAGQYAAGGPSYTFQIGPNGQRYAVGGEVPIDVGKERTPEETLAKMEQVSRAALAPLNPSAADRRIAARASILSAQARREIQLESTSEQEIGQTNRPSSSSPPEPADQSPEAASSSQHSDDQDSGVASNSRHMVLRAYQAQSV